MIIILDLKYCSTLIKNFLKTVAKKILYLYLSLCYLVSWPKRIKLSNGLTKLFYFVNKDYDHDYDYLFGFIYKVY